MQNKNIQEIVQEFFELLNRYPSPHNGQPIQLMRKSQENYEILFNKSRGLQSTEISFIFSFVSMGVFTTYVELCAKALGHNVNVQINLPKESELRGEGRVSFGNMNIQWSTSNPSAETLEALQFRQTSRKKYTSGASKDFIDMVQGYASSNGMQLTQLNQAQAKQAVWLNQRAVFDDVQDKPVREELNHWLRYSKSEKHEKMDGLAYDCMELNGPIMKFIIKHPGILKNKAIASILKKYYLRTMTDNSDVFYMLAPFETELNSYEVGKTVMKIWHEASLHKLYIHPFGTIMSNATAHSDFIKLAEVSNESRSSSYLVFIFRAGYSLKPAESLRMPFNNHLIIQG